MSDNYIILEGKNISKLVEMGLKKLNKSREEVDVEIIEEGKSIMGIATKKSKIKIQ